MTDREKLSELLYKPFIQHKINKLSDTADIADHLISHGVTFEKQGKWIMQETNALFLWNLKYSACGKDFHTTVGYNYCPNCGARMKGEKT